MTQRLNFSSGVLVAAVLATTSFTAVETRAEALEVRNAKVSVICPMTVGGSFEAKTSAMSGQVAVEGDAPASLAVALSVDLSTLDSGIASRDHHMLESYLEVNKGENFKDAKLTGVTLTAAKLEGQVPFNANFTVHGQTRPVFGTAKIHKGASGYEVEASFPMKVSEFQIPKPTYLGVGVKDEVKINVAFTAASKSEGSK